MRAPILIAACFLLAISGAHASAETVSTTLADCDARVRTAPKEFDSYSCYWFVGRNQGLLNEAAQRLEGLLQIDPGNSFAQLYLGILLADLGQARAEEVLREATDGFAVLDNPRGEVYARVSLSMFYHPRGRIAESWQELEAALDRAVRAAEPDLETQVRINLAWQKYYAREYGQAWDQLKAVERIVFPDGTNRQRVDALDALAAVSWALGRNGDALEYYRRMTAELGGGDPYRESMTRRNMALVARDLAAMGRISDAELLELERASLDAAIRGENRLAESGARLLLATTLDGEEGIEQARRGLAVARELDKFGDVCWALWLLGEKTLRLHPDRTERAFAFADEAVELARSRGDAEYVARGSIVRAKMRWMAGPRDRAVTETLDALAAVERIRDLQPEGESRARVFSRFADDYRWLAAWVLGAPGEPSGEEIELGFGIVERMRARSLLDTLDATGAASAQLPPGVRADERAAILEQIAAIRRELRQAELPRAERSARLQRLSELEQAEASLREALFRRHPDYAALRAAEPATIREVQQRLRPDQALLSFQLIESPLEPEDGFPPGSWVSLVTKASARAVPLTACAKLDRRVRLYLALLQRRDRSERPGAERLYRDLLAAVLDDLPPAITTLIVIPDGPLHRLPLGTLIDPARAGTLAERFRIFVDPSAATWLRLTEARSHRPRFSLLALADPRLDPSQAPGPLPHAGREALALSRYVGPGGRVIVGPEATESAFKSAALSDFRLIHLATHALANDEFPERSAVLLARGAGETEEDGRLGFGEIVDLDLDGQLVVLSSCRSGSGTLIGGEGVIGLANAFFQAGARSVVAGLWPVRDRETAELIDRFGEHLSGGHSVSEAMTRARRDLIRDGSPPAAWAGMIVLGDGDLVPWPGKTSPAGTLFGPLALVALLALAALAAILARSKAGA